MTPPPSLRVSPTLQPSIYRESQQSKSSFYFLEAVLVNTQRCHCELARCLHSYSSVSQPIPFSLNIDRCLRLFPSASPPSSQPPDLSPLIERLLSPSLIDDSLFENLSIAPPSHSSPVPIDDEDEESELSGEKTDQPEKEMESNKRSTTLKKKMTILLVDCSLIQQLLLHPSPLPFSNKSSGNSQQKKEKSLSVWADLHRHLQKNSLATRLLRLSLDSIPYSSLLKTLANQLLNLPAEFIIQVRTNNLFTSLIESGSSSLLSFLQDRKFLDDVMEKCAVEIRDILVANPVSNEERAKKETANFKFAFFSPILSDSSSRTTQALLAVHMIPMIVSEGLSAVHEKLLPLLWASIEAKNVFGFPFLEDEDVPLRRDVNERYEREESEQDEDEEIDKSSSNLFLEKEEKKVRRGKKANKSRRTKGKSSDPTQANQEEKKEKSNFSLNVSLLKSGSFEEVMQKASEMEFTIFSSLDLHKNRILSTENSFQSAFTINEYFYRTNHLVLTSIPLSHVVNIFYDLLSSEVPCMLSKYHLMVDFFSSCFSYSVLHRASTEISKNVFELTQLPVKSSIFLKRNENNNRTEKEKDGETESRAEKNKREENEAKKQESIQAEESKFLSSAVLNQLYEKMTNAKSILNSFASSPDLQTTCNQKSDLPVSFTRPLTQTCLFASFQSDESTEEQEGSERKAKTFENCLSNWRMVLFQKKNSENPVSAVGLEATNTLMVKNVETVVTTVGSQLYTLKSELNKLWSTSLSNRGKVFIEAIEDHQRSLELILSLLERVHHSRQNLLRDVPDPKASTSSAHSDWKFRWGWSDGCDLMSGLSMHSVHLSFVNLQEEIARTKKVSEALKFSLQNNNPDIQKAIQFIRTVKERLQSGAVVLEQASALLTTSIVFSQHTQPIRRMNILQFINRYPRTLNADKSAEERSEKCKVQCFVGAEVGRALPEPSDSSSSTDQTCFFQQQPEHEKLPDWSPYADFAFFKRKVPVIQNIDCTFQQQLSLILDPKTIPPSPHRLKEETQSCCCMYDNDSPEKKAFSWMASSLEAFFPLHRVLHEWFFWGSPTNKGDATPSLPDVCELNSNTRQCYDDEFVKSVQMEIEQKRRSRKNNVSKFILDFSSFLGSEIRSFCDMASTPDVFSIENKISSLISLSSFEEETGTLTMDHFHQASRELFLLMCLYESCLEAAVQVSFQDKYETLLQQNVYGNPNNINTIGQDLVNAVNARLSVGVDIFNERHGVMVFIKQKKCLKSFEINEVGWVNNNFLRNKSQDRFLIAPWETKTEMLRLQAKIDEAQRLVSQYQAKKREEERRKAEEAAEATRRAEIEERKKYLTTTYSIVGGVFLLLSIALFVFFRMSSKKSKRTRSSQVSSLEPKIPSVQTKHSSVHQLLATKPPMHHP